MKNSWHYLRVMMQLFKRDLYVFSYNWKKFAINYGLISPATTIICFGYLFANITMHNPTDYAITNFIVGNNLWQIFLIAFSLNIGMLFDIHAERVIDYQLMLIKPQLVIVERIIFSALVSFINLLPFYPLTKLILGSTFLTTGAHWFEMVVILFLGTVFCSVYTTFFVFFVRDIGSIGNFFMRMNVPLIQLGGSFVPWYVMNSYSTLFGRIIRANPMLYISEGFRQAILGGQNFFSFYTCVFGLIAFSGIFLMLTLYFFKKKLDHV